MQQPMQPILQHLFQVSSLDDLSRQRLEAFVEEHPSFGIGHYLLSRKLKAEGSGQFEPETQKTGLYFSNPFWLQWQLEHVAFDGGHQATTVEQEFAATEWSAPVAPVEEPAVAVEEPAAAVEEPAAAVEEPAVLAEPEFPVEHPVEAAEPGTSLEEHKVVPEEEPVAAANVVAVAEENYEQPNEVSAADQLLRSIEEAKGLRHTLDKINTDFDAGPETAAEPTEEPIHDEEPPFVLDEGTKPEPETVPIHDDEAPFVLEETEAPVAEVKAEPIAEVPHQAAAEPVVPASPHIPTIPGQAPPKDLVFEPYHTIDYFASQGIKFAIDDNPTDKFGRQLKSFTEWLKGMRRLPNKDREVIPDRVAEEAVQTSAAHSVEGKDVLTETMAEVLAKQGMRERARAVYEKLSLLNPDKRAYFAAKIEQLNIP